LPPEYECKLPVTSKQREAIGTVAVEWSYLESVVDAAIWTLADLWREDIGLAITAHLPLPPRLDILLTLFRLQHEADERIEQLERLCKRIRVLSGRRNEIVHSRWVEGIHPSLPR